MISSYFTDQSQLRLVWIIPLSLVLWAVLLMVFALLLERTSPPPPALAPARVRIVEVPPTPGLQGGKAVRHLAKRAATPKIVPPRPHPRVSVRRAPIPAVPVHAVKEKAPPSTAAKEPTEVLPVAQPSAPNQSSAKLPGKAGDEGAESGVGIGSDSAGARAIYAPMPEIPDTLREDTFETVAIARFKVSRDAHVQVTLTTPTDSPELNQILLDTLRQWRFFPAMKAGVAVDSQFDLRIPISVQ